MRLILASVAVCIVESGAKHPILFFYIPRSPGITSNIVAAAYIADVGVAGRQCFGHNDRIAEIAIIVVLVASISKRFEH